MKIGIMQPYFFPYLGYWQLINAVDKYVIYDDVNYIKNGWINRNNILLNGQKHLLTLPLDGASPFLLINQIKMTSNIKVKEKILKTVEQAYKKAPFYKLVYPIIEKLIMNKDLNIAVAIYNSIKDILLYLNINTELILSSSLDKDNSLKGQDKVLNICKLLKGTEYYNAIGGQELYSANDFQEKNIELKFLKMNDICYKQFNNQFVSGLSIIDILMFNSVEEIHKMLNEYTIIIPKK